MNPLQLSMAKDILVDEYADSVLNVEQLIEEIEAVIDEEQTEITLTHFIQLIQSIIKDVEKNKTVEYTIEYYVMNYIKTRNH